MSWSQGLVPSFILSWNVCCTAVVVFFSMVWRWFFKMEGLQTAAGDGRKLLEWNLGSWKRDKGDLCRKAWPHWPGYSSSSGQCSSVLLDGDGEHKMWAGWQLGCWDFLCGRVPIFPGEAELVIVLSGGWEITKECCFHLFSLQSEFNSSSLMSPLLPQNVSSSGAAN